MKAEMNQAVCSWAIKVLADSFTSFITNERVLHPPPPQAVSCNFSRFPGGYFVTAQLKAVKRIPLKPRSRYVIRDGMKC